VHNAIVLNFGAKVRIIIEIANKNKIKRANDVMTPIYEFGFDWSSVGV